MNKERLKIIDSIHLDLIEKINSNKLNNKEVAALLTSVMKNVLTMSNNKALLESMGVDTNRLTPEAVTLIQRVWAEEVAVELKEQNDKQEANIDNQEPISKDE